MNLSSIQKSIPIHSDIHQSFGTNFKGNENHAELFGIRRDPEGMKLIFPTEFGFRGETFRMSLINKVE